MMIAKNRFPCQVCGYLYETAPQAFQCAEKHGYPALPKYSVRKIVTINNHDFKEKKAKIIKIGFTQPGCISRKKVHLLLYLLRFENGCVTTAIEEEITLI